MKKISIFVASAILLPFTFHLSLCQAQEEGTYNESVVVKGSYRPVIEQHEKLYFPAAISDTTGTMEYDFQYNINPMRMRSLYAPSRIRAARIVGEPATKLYNNYLRLGFGNYWSPMADLYWSSTRDRKKTYGVQVNHRSSWDKLPDYGPNHYGNTNVTLFGKYIFKETLQLTTDLGYEHDHNLYYGFTDNTLQTVMGKTRDAISTKDYTASYNVAHWNIGFRNMELDANKLGYAVNVHVSDLWGVYGQNELNLNIDGDIHYGFNIKDKYKGVAYLHAEWDRYRNQKPDDHMPLGYTGILAGDLSHGNIVKINPYADFMFYGLQFRTGLTAGWDGYAVGSVGSVFHLFPDVTVSKKFLKDKLVLSLAAKGGMDAVNLNVLRQINPFITPDYTPVATYHYDFIFHTRWTIGRKLEANAEVSYSLLEGDPVFHLNPAFSLNNVYEPIFLSDNRLVAGGDIAFVNDEMITLRAGGHYYNYTFTGIGTLGDTYVKLYRPDWDALVSAKVNYHDKWFFYLEGSLMGEVKDEAGNSLPMRYGIAAEVEYRHNRALSFFLRGDNLAFQRYWLWSNYPSQRGLILAGLTYTIPHK